MESSTQEVLEDKLEQAFQSLNIPQNQKDSIKVYLNLIKNKDLPTYQHSIEVGLKSLEVADFLHLDKKPLFYAGVLHDTGKALTNSESLKKTRGFNTRDMRELEKHPIDGYKLLKGIHPFSAEILVRHHQYGKNPYPRVLPTPDIDFSRGTKTMIAYFSRLLGLIDFYKALTTRENQKFSEEGRLPTREEAKKILLDNNPDQQYLIKELFKAGVF